MSDVYIGEVRLVGFNFAPSGWLFCNGMQLGISSYNALYTLIGTTYGGDGQNTFNLPNLQGRIPIHQGSDGTNTYTMGQVGGVEQVTLTLGQYPAHTHNLMASNNQANSSTAGNATVGQGASAYTNQAPVTPMNPLMIGSSGNNGPHENRQPYQALNWIIAIDGIYPAPS